MKDFWFIVFIFFLNLPFGYWRAKVRKFSLSWVLAIHVPVLIIIGSRFAFHIPYKFITLPLNVGAFFIAQYLGGKYYLIKSGKENV
ncbi:MAG: hypothetical protein H6539_04670 [Bacteroidales bacterium]|nr:hypothetical protein [Bacteroidales bacterium]